MKRLKILLLFSLGVISVLAVLAQDSPLPMPTAAPSPEVTEPPEPPTLEVTLTPSLTPTETPSALPTDANSTSFLVTPVEEINVSRRPLLIWLAQPDAVSYQIVMRRDGKVVRRIPVSVEACYNGYCSLDWSLRPDLFPLKANATFEWRVRVNTAQKTRASSWAMFSVGDDTTFTPTPEIYVPAYESVATLDPSFPSSLRVAQVNGEMVVVTVSNVSGLITAVREAVDDSRATGRHYVILIEPGVYTFHKAYQGVVTPDYSAVQEILNGAKITLRGVGSDGTSPAAPGQVILQRSLRAIEAFDFFYIWQNGELTLYDLTLRYGGLGKPGGMTATAPPPFTGTPNLVRKDGGAIVNTGTLHLFRVIFQDNDVSERGGALFNRESGLVELAKVRFISNQAGKTGTSPTTGAGGAIYNLGQIRVVNPNPTQYCVLFDRNKATGPSGGAVYSAATGSLWLDRSVFFLNVAQTPGYGGIYVPPGSNPTATPTGTITPIAYARNSWWNPAWVKATAAKQRVSDIVDVTGQLGAGTLTPPAVNCIPPTPITPTPTPSFTPTPPPCSVFGCSSDSLPVEYGTNHVNQANAVDFVPVGVTSGAPSYWLLNNLWPDDPRYISLKNVYSPVAGEVRVYMPPPGRKCMGCGDIRVRTSDGICYQFKHMVPNSDLHGTTISQWGQIGQVIAANRDDDLGGAGVQSHLHMDRFLCDDDFVQTAGTVSGNIRDIVPYIVNR